MSKLGFSLDRNFNARDAQARSAYRRPPLAASARRENSGRWPLAQMTGLAIAIAAAGALAAKFLL